MATIDAVYVAVYRHDLRLARCCVASIRRWHPDVPIALLKDIGRGDFDTSGLERHFGVEVRPEHVGVFGWGMSKLIPLTVPTGERVVVLDADTVVYGRVLDRLAAHDADVVATFWDPDGEELRRHYLVPELLGELAPGVPVPARVFNTGAFVTRTGALSPDDLAEWVDPGPPPTTRRPDAFRAGDQGLVNFLVHRAALAGTLSTADDPFMVWGGQAEPLAARAKRALAIRRSDGPRTPVVFHWAGPKPARFRAMPNGFLLRHYERAYHRQVPGGRRALAVDVVRREWALRRGGAPGVRSIETPD